MAKVLIATLGTGRMAEGKEEASKRAYEPAEYKIDASGKQYNTPFVVAALAEELKVDKIILVGTGNSMWEEVYKYFTEKHDGEVDIDYWIGLGEKVTSRSKTDLITDKDLLKANKALDKYLAYLKKDATGGSKCITLEYGLNAGELWKNFETFMEIEQLLEKGDEIYLDITHAFRSIPIFMYLMMDFIDTLQSNKGEGEKIKLAGIYYGMFEGKQDDVVPIIDLEPLFSISKWIRATHSFVNYGKGFLMASLVKNTELKKSITNISEQISINYLVELRREINDLDKKIKALEKNNTEEIIFAYMIPTLKEFIARFTNLNNDSNFQLAMAKWYFDNKIYSNGYICLAEAVITRLCEIYSLNITNKYNRDLIRPLTWVINNPFKGRDEQLDNLVHIYSEINPIRNKIAHASFDTHVKIQGRNEKLDHKDDISRANHYYTQLNMILNSDRLDQLPRAITLKEIRSIR